MLEVVPAGPDADLDPPAAHLVDGRDDLGEVARMPERDRRDQGAEPDAIGLPGEAGQDRPRVGGRLPGRAREARVVVGAEQRLEAVGLGALRDGDLVAVGQALLGLDHQRETHRRLLHVVRTVHVDRMIHSTTIVHMTRSYRARHGRDRDTTVELDPDRPHHRRLPRDDDGS